MLLNISVRKNWFVKVFFYIKDDEIECYTTFEQLKKLEEGTYEYDFIKITNGKNNIILDLDEINKMDMRLLSGDYKDKLEKGDYYLQDPSKEDKYNYYLNADLTKNINKILEIMKDDGLSRKGISDGYHTFEELYYHRMILFSVILNSNPDKSWKAKKHHDGTMFDEDSFICGIETPEGQYSYHYKLQYWNNFKVKELEFAPEWDGHKPKDINRLLSLGDEND